jgi:GxxExxY protein
VPDFEKLTAEHEETAAIIVDSAFKVHKNLGPGLLERVYENCFCHELSKSGCVVENQVEIPVEYDGMVMEDAFRADVVVNGIVLCELKSVDEMKSVFEAQLLTYMKFAKMRLGFLINFNVPIITDFRARAIV